MCLSARFHDQSIWNVFNQLLYEDTVETYVTHQAFDWNKECSEDSYRTIKGEEEQKEFVVPELKGESVSEFECPRMCVLCACKLGHLSVPTTFNLRKMPGI